METAESQCPGCRAATALIEQLQQRIVELERRNADLAAVVEQLQRTAKRQAAPFSRGTPKADPKRPGRKPGPDYGPQAFREVPQHIDEILEAALPKQCPRCGGTVHYSHTVQQYQVEIPRRPIRRQFKIAVGQCLCCGQRVQGRHPLQTSNATGCCASQIGPQAQAAVVLLNKELGLSQGKISRFMDAFFGIKLSRGGSCQIMQRAAASCEWHYAAIVTRVQSSRFIVPDETGWRIAGQPAWMHVAVGETATAYLIAPQRGKEASDLLIGPAYGGVLIHDGWSPYDRYQAADHQTCLGHLLKRCQELLERARGGAAVFPRKVKGLLQDALAFRDLRDAGKLAPQRCAGAAGGLEYLMHRLIAPRKTHVANEQLAGHLFRHLHQLFTFLREPGIDATNHRAEQAIRPAVVNRKVWGGNRTPAGAVAQSILMSILFTLRQNRQDALEFLSRQLQSPHLIALPAPAG